MGRDVARVVGHISVMRLLPLLCLPLLLAGACQTARGHVEAGRLEQGCLAVERAPSPLIDDDGRALAARIRRRLEGSIHVRAVPIDELQTIARAAPAADTAEAAPAADVVVRDAPAVVDIAVVGDGVLRLRAVTLIAADGTRLQAPVLTEDVVLDLVGAPPPPPPTVHTSTQTPGPFEALMKGIGIAMIGLPLSIATLGAIPPDLGGALSPTATTTWTTDHPDLQAWKARPEVQAAARLGAFFELGRAPCAGGRCRQVLTLARADAWRQAELEISLGVGDCAIEDVITVNLGAAIPFKDTPADDGQWGRFWDEGLGLRPVVEDIGEGIDDCVECGASCFGC